MAGRLLRGVPPRRAEPSGRNGVGVLVGATAALGAAGALAGAMRMRRRRRWLRAVRRGELPGWMALPREDVHVPLDEARPLFRTSRAGDLVVLRRVAAAHGAYRTAETHEPYAVAPR